MQAKPVHHKRAGCPTLRQPNEGCDTDLNDANLDSSQPVCAGAEWSNSRHSAAGRAGQNLTKRAGHGLQPQTRRSNGTRSAKAGGSSPECSGNQYADYHAKYDLLGGLENQNRDSLQQVGR